MQEILTYHSEFQFFFHYASIQPAYHHHHLNCLKFPWPRHLWVRNKLSAFKTGEFFGDVMDHHPTLTNGKILAIIKVIIAIIFRTSQRKIQIFWVLKSHVTLFWLFWWIPSSSFSCNLINPLPNIVYNNKASAARYKPPKNGNQIYLD